MKTFQGIISLAMLLAAGSANAHGIGSSESGLVAGLMHPITGWDHLLAMVAVGIWAANLGGMARWTLPVAFVVTMAIGGLLAVQGMPLFSVESGIALSVLVFGALISLSARPPTWVAILLVAFFAMFHGYAHGTEIPVTASIMAYSLGFAAATALLHVAGLIMGNKINNRLGKTTVRVTGGLIAVTGTLLLAGSV